MPRYGIGPYATATCSPKMWARHQKPKPCISCVFNKCYYIVLNLCCFIIPSGFLNCKLQSIFHYNAGDLLCSVSRMEHMPFPCYRLNLKNCQLVNTRVMFLFYNHFTSGLLIPRQIETCLGRLMVEKG